MNLVPRGQNLSIISLFIFLIIFSYFLIIFNNYKYEILTIYLNLRIKLVTVEI